jgi:hypothetical protein
MQRAVFYLFLCLLIQGFLVGPIALADEPAPPAPAPKEAADNAPSKTPQQHVSKLIYKPPKRGAPGGRVAGGTRDPGRGGTATFPVLAAIAPEDHTGLTADSQPILYWYISEPSPLPIRFTLTYDHKHSSPHEIALAPLTRPGLQWISLADHHIRLEPDVRYRWLVTVGPGPDHRTNYRFAGADIEHVPFSEALTMKLRGVKNSDKPAFYAQEGYWYDTVIGISQQIGKQPGEIELRRQRASLFQQVGLQDVAEAEISEEDRR